MEELFKRCKEINDLLTLNEEQRARDLLIILLQELKDKDIEYTPLVNHLIREVGLYQYIDEETADWQERFVVEAFKVNAGGSHEVTLHREQSGILKALIEGENLAISAPTSFGKSFIIDTFIEIKRPNTVVIIVPTLALTDETRRRLYKKFSHIYKVITTTGVVPGEKSLFIFPQERALQYVESIPQIDLLIVDEFYKAGRIGGGTIIDERTPQLIEAISLLSRKATQRYFLAPNISELKDNPFTVGMRFEMIDFNTVYTQITPVYKTFNGNKSEKERQKFYYLEQNLASATHKSIIYVNSHPELHKVANKISDFFSDVDSDLLQSFSLWLRKHYADDYLLAKLIKKGIGVHNGRLHRSLTQIQIKLFEMREGLKNLISTSSLIEGVNTSAGNVIIWSNKNAHTKFDYFTYKNIIGRSGRMFKHFVGQVYLLEPPPEESFPSLELDYPDVLLERLDPEEYMGELTPEQIARIKENETRIDQLLGERGSYRQVLMETATQSMSKPKLMDVITSIRDKRNEWQRKLPLLLSPNPEYWKGALFLIMPLLWNVCPFQGRYTQVVHFIQGISHNWHKSIPELLTLFQGDEISIEQFFDLEKKVSYNLASLLHSINAVAKRMLSLPNLDISPFITKVSNAFLPPIVFELEEYGLPRMLSRQLQNRHIIDLEKEGVSINEILDDFREIGINRILEAAQLEEIDRFILSHFFDGITPATTL